MSFSYAASFWPVPFFSQIQSDIAVSLGASAGEGAWYGLQPGCYRRIYLQVACTGSHRSSSPP